MTSLDDIALSKVNLALLKLCQSYASERISKSLFRYQRAALIEFLQKANSPFPDLVFNEYSQAIDDDFVLEDTPVVDDLGFTTDLNNTPTLREMAPKYPLLQPSSEPELSSRPSFFDRYYWQILIAFVLFFFLLYLFIEP